MTEAGRMMTQVLCSNTARVCTTAARTTVYEQKRPQFATVVAHERTIVVCIAFWMAVPRQMHNCQAVRSLGPTDRWPVHVLLPITSAAALTNYEKQPA